MKRIVIVGASSGIGRRMALDFAADGWRVGVAARRTDRLEEIRSRYPQQVEVESIDVTAPDAAERLRGLIDRLGGMDLLLYAAGCGWYNPELDPQRELATVAVNCNGFTRILGEGYRYFRQRVHEGEDRPGRIVAISSVAGTKGLGAAPAYSATKRYGATYLQALGQLARLQRVPVSITDIRPGFIATDLLDPDTKYPALMTLDYAAPRIKRAVLHGGRVSYIDWRWHIAVALWRLIPDCLWRRLPIKLK